ncbi:MAG: hypothetical protein FWB96_13520 [Defluviitaleaceae bacterium]|nr:hypothetical protein [Defluviitaleaceae bacterium]MCL2264340.1 hypothetical protein [Defluviitaleaceae bacterium]
MMTVRSMALNHLRADGFHGIGFPGSRTQNTGGVNSGANQSEPVANANIRSAGQAISGALRTLAGAGGELQGRTSDAEVATVRVDNNRTIASMPPRDTSIDVRQVAQAQTHVGDAMTASARNVSAGTHTFEIETGGRTHTFNVNVLEGDDNAAIQRRMAATINAADIGITASVRAGREDGAAVSTLTVASSQTGTDNEFSIRDAAGSNLVHAMQVDGSTEDSQAAQNALFTVNGGAVRESQSNDVNIGAGVTATLTGTGQTEITFGRSAENALSAARDLVNAINSAIRGTNANDGRGSERFLNHLIGTNVTFASTLSRAGIQVQRNGQLAIDESRLQAAAESGALENLGGFASRMERISSNAVNTRHYANSPPPVEMRLNNFDFGNNANLWSSFNTVM